MKILYLVHQFFPEFQSGTEHFVYNMAMMAQKLGNKVKVVAYSGYEDDAYPNEDGGVLSKEYLYRGIPVLSFKLKNPPIDLTYALSNPALLEFAGRVLQAEAPNLLHAGHSMRVHPFITAAAARGLPYLLTLTDFFLLCPKVILAPTADSLCGGPLGGQACGRLCPELGSSFITERLRQAGQILRGAGAIVTPSRFVKDIFLQEFPGLPAQVIGHGIRFKNLASNRRVYRSGDRLVFGYAGTLAAHKGLHVLVKAIHELPDANIELRVYGAGQEDYLRRVNELAAGDPRIRFLGTFSPEQAGQVYAGLDALVIPSVCYESYSLVLHEALAAGVPVIGSDLGGIGEKIEEGRSGYAFPAGDAAALREKLAALARDPEQLNALKQAIRRAVYIPPVEAEAYRYLKIYQGLGGTSHE